ncbi:hypothetical protein FRC01_006278 [Tulasnella sp. 417]|nr:hypothetical protein FRC01_006278 [Tulasnella sp. 417]
MATYVSKRLGTSNPARKVAVKKLKFGAKDPGEAFINEFQILDGLSHQNIIESLGFVEDLDKKIAWIVTPWEANGNVREFLLSGDWDIPEHFGCARVLRKGLRAESNQPNPQPFPDTEQSDNCSLEAILSDSDGVLTLSGPNMSFRWASPEVLAGEDPDLASDIWAFGWICWEVMTDNYPFPNLESLEGVVSTVVKEDLPRIYENEQLSQMRSLCMLMTRCWRSKSILRPTAEDCKASLQDMPHAIPGAEGAGDSKIRSAVLMIALGDLQRRGGKYDEAWVMFNDALSVAQASGNERATGRALFMMGVLQMGRSKFENAKEHFSQALAIFTRIGDGWNRGNTLLVLGQVHHAMNQYAEAEECLNEALASPTELRDTWMKMSAWHLLGEIQKARSEFGEADKSFRESLELSFELGKEVQIANGYYSLGEVSQALGKHEDAEELFDQALAIYEGLGEDFSHANCLLRLGNIQAGLEKFEEAQRLLTEAFEIYRRLGNDSGQANVLGEMGDIHADQLKLDEAEECYIQAMDVYSREGDERGRATILFGLGRLHLERSKYSEAEGTIAEALDIYTRLEDGIGKTNSLLLLGRLRTFQGRYAEAKTLIQTASWLAVDLNYDAALTLVDGYLNEVYDAEIASTKVLLSSSDQDTPQKPSDDADESSHM